MKEGKQGMTAPLHWSDVIGNEKQQPYFQHILTAVKQARLSGKTIYPPAKDVFNAFRYTDFDHVNVVILGQDPYHGPNQAHGLSFSVQPHIAPPPSLINIYKELATDIPGFVIPSHGCLEKWARQGVLLLNTVLTVERGKPHSHAELGWDTFTDKVIKTVSDKRKGVVFLLWGAHAQRKRVLIDSHNHYILSAPHPSPYSADRGFFGCHHFSKTNQLLSQQGKSPIDWQL